MNEVTVGDAGSDNRAAYEQALGRHRKASPSRASTLRRTGKLTDATMAMKPKISAEALAEAAARHVHPRHRRGPAQ